MALQPKSEIANLKVCPHGGPILAELKAYGLTPETVLDFSVCSNPFPPPLGVKEVLDTVAVNRYPDSEATELRECLAGRLGMAPDNILVGSGTTELIRLIALAYFGHGDAVLILEPTFGEYEVACQIVGSAVVKQWAQPGDGFALKIEETISLIKMHQPKGVFVCNPNNPTGNYLGREEIRAILAACSASLLILDEAYVSFVDTSWSSLELIHRGNLIVLRSMTKDYALAGLRLGYALASQEIISVLRRVCPPWNVNIVAQKAGVAALNEAGYLDRCKREIRQAKQFLVGELNRLGFALVPSKANFFLVKVGDAQAFRTALLKQGILVRDGTSFGLPEYIRIAPRTLPECQKLITAIKALKQAGELIGSEKGAQNGKTFI